MSNTTQPLSNTTTLRDRIESKVLPENTDKLTVGAGGAMTFGTMSDIMEFAKLMSISGVAVPKHLRENPGACLAVVIQASEWRMSPYAVANKSYSVNDRLAYEAQMINAVILRRAPIKGRFKISYSGEAERRRCKVSVDTLDGETVEYESPEIGKITVKNSPLWKSDPDQQLFYFASRSMCRRHFPDVLQGVYTMDEMLDADPQLAPRNVTPTRQEPVAGRIAEPVNPYEDAPQAHAIAEPAEDLWDAEDTASNQESGK